MKMRTTILGGLVLAAGVLWTQPAKAAGPVAIDLKSCAHFVILAGAGITTTGNGPINGDVGASPIAGSAIGVTDAQVNGTIYAVDASGPAGSVIDASQLTTAKGDLTAAYNAAAGRTPVPAGPFLNPGSGNIGGLNLVPGLYKFTSTAMITGSDVTLTGGPEDVWIFQCAQDLLLGSGIQVILAGGAQARNIFWQVGTSAVLETFSVFKGTILADQSITMKTSSTMEGRALARIAGVTFNGTGSSLPGDRYESDPSAATAKTIGNTQLQYRSIHTAGNVDWVKFVVGGIGARNLWLETSGLSDDTQMWLYKGDGTLVAYNDNGGEGNFSMITVASLTPGSYFIKIQEYGNNGTIPFYALRANWATQYAPVRDSYEADDSTATAKTIGNTQLQYRSIHTAGNVDWVKFFTGSTGIRNLRLETSGASGDTQMWLYKGNGTLVAYNDNGGGGSFSLITAAALTPGSYFIKIQEYGNNGTIPSYALRANWSR